MKSYRHAWWSVAAAALLAALAGVVVGMGMGVSARAQGHANPATDIELIVHAQRQTADGATRSISLPDEVEGAASDPGPLTVRYLWRSELGARPKRVALYASGLLGAARLRLNGQSVVDDIGDRGDALPPRRRGAAAIRLFELPEALLHPGTNEFTLDVVAHRRTSLSALRLGDREALLAMQQRKIWAMVTAPTLVATLIAALGLSVLVVWVRRPAERQNGYFGVAAAAWGVHTWWTVAPQPLLSGVHLGVWWNTVYALVVVMLVLFALRFAQRANQRVERYLLLALLATPWLLYFSAAFDSLLPATDVLRLGLVCMAFAALLVVARHAWHRRSGASALFVVAGLASAGLGLRDWWVFRYGSDNYPAQWTPYAGAPFILLVSWILIDRFVRTAHSLEAANNKLEARMAQREAELANNYERFAQLEREQGMGEERQRLMRELHDGLGARLLNALFRVEGGTLQQDGLAQQLRDCLADMRLASETLTPGQTELGAAMGNFVFRWEVVLRDAGVKTKWRLDLPAAGLPTTPYVALQLLRIAQEALANVLRHARATTVEFMLAGKGDQLVLNITDNGQGIDGGASPPGRGLADMRTRAVAVGAELVLSTPAGGGTRIALSLPLQSA